MSRKPAKRPIDSLTMKNLARGRPPGVRRKLRSGALVAARYKSGLSGRETALRIGLKNSAVYHSWESGRTNPPVEAVKALARLFRVTQKSLFEAK